MGDSDKNFNNVELHLRERMATLEASNAFHQEALHEISSSLKEVVRTQHVLATQKEEIVKLVATVNDTQQAVRGIEGLNAELRYKLDTLAEKNNILVEAVDILENDVDVIASKVRANTAFVSNVVKVSLGVISPLIVAVVLQIAKVI